MSVKLRERSLSKNKKGYFLDIHHDGRRWTEFQKIYIKPNDPDKKEKKALLEGIRAKRELELNFNDNGFNPKFRKSVNFIEYYQQYCKNYKKKDARTVESVLAKFIEFNGSNHLLVKDIDTNLCTKFMNYLKDESKLSGETPKSYFARFKKAVKQAYMDGILPNKPTEGITFKSGGKISLKKQVLTKEELQSIATTPCGNENIKNAFLFACFTGLGIAEIRKLNKIHINNGKIKIYREKTGEEIWNDLSQTAIKILEKYELTTSPVFVLPSDTGVNKTLGTLMKRAKIEKKITFYCGRHTFAVQLLLNGANLKTVADLMGHTSTKETIKYLSYVDSLKTDAVKNLPNIEI